MLTISHGLPTWNALQINNKLSVYGKILMIYYWGKITRI